MQITICGGGNAAHTATGQFSARQEHQVHVYLPFGDEAEKWSAGISAQGGIKVNRQGDSILGSPEKVSSDPAEVIPGSQVVLLALPAFAHEWMRLSSQLHGLPFAGSTCWQMGMEMNQV